MSQKQALGHPIEVLISTAQLQFGSPRLLLLGQIAIGRALDPEPGYFIKLCEVPETKGNEIHSRAAYA